MNNHSLNTTVPPQWHRCRLDKVLSHLFPSYSRTYLKRQIQFGNVYINSHPVKKSNFLTLANQSIQIYPAIEPASTPWKGNASITLSIVYEDEALLIINKPPGLVTHPSLGHPDHTLANAVLNYLAPLEQLPRAGIIHRLDKNTSGLLVIPKTLAVYTYLVRELAAHKIKRIYQAVVKGHCIAGNTINRPIGRHPTLRQKQAVIPNGKPAITHYRIVEHFKNHTLLAIQLETGRTHQIRVHMAHLNHPIVGDTVYGHHTIVKGILFERQALHAHRLSLIHPLTQRYLHCEVPVPKDMAQLISALRTES